MNFSTKSLTFILLFSSICFAQPNAQNKKTFLRSNQNMDAHKFLLDDENLKEKIIAKLRKYGFRNVEVEVSNEGEVVLRGTVPKGKLGKVMLLVNELKPRKIENQLTEEQ